MALNLTPEFLIFSLSFIVLNFIFDLLAKKLFHINGIDFLFFAPWLAGIRFGYYEGLILAAIILVTHVSLHMRIARFILLSYPAQAVSVIMGHFFGLEGFWVTLVIYYFLSTGLTFLLGGIGGGYFMFLLVNTITNVVSFFTWRVLF